MLYKIITSGILKNYKTAFSILLIISCITTFSSCMTTYNYMEDSKAFIPDSTAKITKIQLNNGLIINCTDKIFKFETGADSVKNLLIRSYIKGEDYKLYWNEKKIPANEISEI